MKQKLINGRWMIWTTDSIADWDAMTGDPVAKRGWEWARMDSMQKNLRYGDTFFDIGTEHGALSVVIGREFVGPENIVLMEPGPEFWSNIRLHWDHNGLAAPAGLWPGFLSDESSDQDPVADFWPAAAGAEVGGMPYRSLNNTQDIRSITVDDYVARTGIAPRALNIDVEGAELKVLKGARWMLDDEHPLVWVSVHPDLMLRDFDTRPADLFDFMLGMDYEAYYLATDHEDHYLFTHEDSEMIL